MVKDFRPISLIGSIYKIIAKILTNRLVGVLGDIVNEVQSAFISERQILDGPFILNEIMQWCRRRKKQSLIFKVDFEKAYDSVRWDFLDDILVKFGFGIKWRGWIQNCLNSSKGSILVNGSPTEEFQFYKGLKQGDPLSPFLFILVMESLHISFQRVVDVGMFTGIKLSSSLNISHLFYADDAIFLGQWNDSNIDTLVHVMECFYRVSGLRINLCKSKIMGIHVDADRIKSAASKLGCLVLNTPFLYLGTKVGENMSRVHAWKEVIVKIKSRLSNWKLKTLSIGGRFTLLKSVLGSTPIFHMSIYKVPSSVLHLLESIRSHFFHGHDPRSKKASWVNWNKVLTAKERGGLGVSSLYALNRGLMCKWVWRFFAHKSLLWSRVIKAIHGPEGGLITDVRRGFRSTWTSIVQEVKKLQNQGVNIFDYIRIKIGNGDNTSFWKDKWHNEGVLKDVFPRLYALERHQNVTIHTKLIDYSLVNSFRRNPRSGVEEFQLDNLSRLVSTITLSSAVDRYVWSLENSGEFSVKSIRQVIDANCFPVIHSATRWVKSVPLKVNIMAWKIKMDGLPTRMNISRRGIEIDSIVCPICNSGAESSCHIFFQCNLVRQLARKISSWWNVDYVDVSSYEEWYTWLVSLRLQANLKAVFEGIFYCLWWSVWMFRNKILFEKDTPSQARIFDNILSEIHIPEGDQIKKSSKLVDEGLKGLETSWNNSTAKVHEGTDEVLEGTAQEYESTAGANLSTAEVYESTAHSLFKGIEIFLKFAQCSLTINLKGFTLLCSVSHYREEIYCQERMVLLVLVTLRLQAKLKACSKASSMVSMVVRWMVLTKFSSRRESVFVKPPHVIASGSSRNSSKESYSSNDMVHNYYLEEAKKKTQDKNTNLKPRKMPSARTHHTPNACTPKLKSNNQMSRNWPASKSSDAKTRSL
ncbi:RNA-directed DNA polymerase, eukaryota, reverse transcriptase zinc-binding domain protein [Tanacetum coccineum]